jgi:UDP-N-acetylglucosamine acyltransferase
MSIHSLAYIEEGVKIGKNVTIEPFAVIKKNVVIEDNVTIKSNAYLDGYTTLKKNVVIWPGASIGTKPQDLKYRGEKSFIEIGENTQIREFVTINSSCTENSKIQVGKNCLIMAYCHIAHNCCIGDNVVMANSSNLAGYVTIEDHVTIGGMTPVHQFSRIGKYAMVGGFSGVSHDIPPFTIGRGLPYRLGGLNIIGLKRKGFSLEVRNELAKAFRLTFRMGLRLEESLKRIESELKPIDEIRYWVNFCRTTKRGIINLEGVTKKSEKNILETMCI